MAKRQRVAILTPSFFDLSGGSVCMGGGERYLVDIRQLLREMGFDVLVYQASTNEPWTAYYKRMEVRSLGVATSLFTPDGKLGEAFEAATRDVERAIYFRFDLGGPSPKERSIGVSHGVWWDLRGPAGNAFREPEGSKAVTDAIRPLARVVANDTNIINYVRGVAPGLDTKFCYIPNYVDTQLFTPGDGVHQGFHVMFPRRLCEARGVDLTIEAARLLLPEIPDIHFDFFGSTASGAGDQRWKREIALLAKEAMGRVSFRGLDMAKMPEAYRGMDLALIPTRGAEGTSLSCLEAMASGVPVVASVVGGLPNMIVDGFNGYLVQPTVPELVAAIRRAYENRGERLRFADCALEVVRSAFDYRTWRGKWEQVIGEVF